MKILNKLFLAFAVVFLLASCKSSQETATYIPLNFDVEVLNLGVDDKNNQRLSVTTSANDKDAVFERAKIEALRDMIFIGFINGSEVVEPIITEYNARAIYNDYFNKFLSKNGAYKNYVELDENSEPELIAKTSKEVAYKVVVLINTGKLRKKLIEDGVLK